MYFAHLIWAWLIQSDFWSGSTQLCIIAQEINNRFSLSPFDHYDGLLNFDYSQHKFL